MGVVKIVLKKHKVIRGQEYPAGTVLLEGTCAGDFTPDDVERGIQNGDVRVQMEIQVLASKPRSKKAEKNEDSRE